MLLLELGSKGLPQTCATDYQLYIFHVLLRRIHPPLPRLTRAADRHFKG